MISLRNIWDALLMTSLSLNTLLKLQISLVDLLGKASWLLTGRRPQNTGIIRTPRLPAVANQTAELSELSHSRGPSQRP